MNHLNLIKIKNFFILIFLISFTFFYETKADIVKPNNLIKPEQVVQIQLKGLMNNNYPKKDNGIRQTWEFAHPKNQKNTGPIEKFTNMIKGNSYKMLLNHLEHKIVEKQLSNLIASYEVTVLDENKTYYKFYWQVEKYTKEGILNGCWLTTMVSAPMSLGSSI
tara:strand:+ start:89 stop:577 length:489 start_codon:yes stop_codon:yes gene_type:complete